MSIDNRTSPTSTAPAAGGARPAGYAGTLAAAFVAVFVAQVANALPASLLGEFQTTFSTQGSQLTWITAAFMVTVVVFEFTFGVLGDLFGRKRLVAIGGVLLVLGAIVSATAQDVHVMWVGAAINGLGAGALFPGSLALLAAVTHSPADRARAIAVWAGFLSAGAAVSPVIGGVFADASSWRGSYWVLAGIALLSVVATLVLSAESTAPEGRGLDVPGQITFAIGMFLLLFGAIQGPEDGWSQWYVVGSFVVGAVVLLAFLLIERKAASPILNLGLFRNRAFAVTSAVTVIGMFAFLGTCFSLAMWIGPVQHQSAMRVAIVFFFLQGPAFVLIPVVSRLLQRISPTWLLTVGFASMAVGAFLLTGLDVNDTSLTPIVWPALLTGIGFALTVSSFTAVAMNTVPLHLAGMASATTNMLRDLGFALGPVLVGAFALSKAGDEFAANLPGAGLPPEEMGPAMGIGQQAGPIAVNSLPPGVPGSGAHQVALDALGSGYSLSLLVCGIAATVAAVVTVVGMYGVRTARPAPESLVDPLHPDLDELPAVDLG
ncbi:MFS transporter [Nocardioides sp. Root1257]|uniref:MFS transporter n=1 Tax=unclassified Nocardioides TaxID=2615069 RepID=UPI0007010132|nr:MULTISPECIES: MFS transporter [unclassified Nocardioides]KQW47334.1 MFS transporter [Nocardioides sp. Root1257]KRC45490.1 MFS transporter [Nocardioides sp. Root224]